MMPWEIRFHDAFEEEFLGLDAETQTELLASARLLGDYGPALGRPHVDTLNGSKHANMKELRFRASGGHWRVAFAFDPRRMGILLVAGDKSGVSSSRFYEQLLDKADKRYAAHLAMSGGATRKKGK